MHNWADEWMQYDDVLGTETEEQQSQLDMIEVKCPLVTLVKRQNTEIAETISHLVMWKTG